MTHAPESDIATPWTLPTDLLLEIVARSDLPTLIRSAAVSKHLRRDILSPPFIHRVANQVAPSILAYCTTNDEEPLTLVHPVTSAISSFCHDYLLPYMSRRATKLFNWYFPVTSRGGLVVLCHILHTDMRSESEFSSDLCVYDPMTNHHTFLSKPPMWSTRNNWQHMLLTAADGISCSFMLLFFVDLKGWKIKVHAITSSSGAWEPVSSHMSDLDISWMSINKCSAPAVLHGGIIHWLVNNGDQIITYDVGTGASGWVNLPPTNHKGSHLHLATSPDGNLLKLLCIDGYKISVWLQLPKVPSGGGWLPENVIDIEDILRPMCLDTPRNGGNVVVQFQGFGKRSGDVVLLKVPKNVSCVVLDLETKEMHIQKRGSSLLEIDLSYHLKTLKAFS
ncbi:hypothetical protein CFC21_111959 [Triticum aestivum]|uniref:DUF7595 domain-containing protein n=2 Tax=Triticum aestivum TaxID=4565 RepID=A0A9R1NFM6_WHEAT|nr:hypothetical protein CFC21_111959 [Triticum aestivum]